MTKAEERLVASMWIEWARGKTITNALCSDFFFTCIRPDRSLHHLNAFEVLDTIVNTEIPATDQSPLKRREPRVLTEEPQ
ncbi:MAG: hypothetical protein AAF515_20885 [Pseudomonadota bacterium]